jgi:Autotransporter beta-domain
MSTKLRQSPLLILTALPALLLFSTAAFADCSTSDTSDCETLPELSQDLLQSRIDRTLATSPTEDRITSRLTEDSWTTDASGVPAPIDATPNGTTFKTSLSDWRKSMSAAERKRVEQALKANKSLKLPQPVQHQASPVDVWVDTHYQSADANAGTLSSDNAATTTYAGADYKRNNFLLGGVVQMDNADQHAATVDDTANANAYMAGPYAAYRLNSKLILDARATWGQSHDTARAGDDTADFSTDRSLTQARLSGSWALNKWQLVPSGAITHVTEDSPTPITGATGDSVQETRLSIRPELKRPFQTENGDKIEPFAYVQSSIAVDNSDLATAAPQNSVGGGLSLITTDKYNLSATADYTQTMDATTPPALTGHLSLSVPLGGK